MEEAEAEAEVAAAPSWVVAETKHFTATDYGRY